MAVTAFALVPVFMLLLALVAVLINPSKIGKYSADFFDAFPEILFYGLVVGVPLAITLAALLSLLAQRGWDTISVSVATGVAISLLLEMAFVSIVMPDDSPGFRDLVLLFVPFACTGALMCAIFWRMVIRHKRHARLVAKRAADAIRTME